ncbi:hypothetical protein [Coxiella-like endosymbiont of Rhipicephalus sanguineus]|uniref:hypothetical protein n=1 Tax=Coxiella-like endosymbiont of Rhipicephalus sanguineus TaxID=1955402 RepID=UPI00203D0DB8|nr:hypothetical protein [Coxiella-like endosymbiont of Rhipicephalus sanguineus]
MAVPNGRIGKEEIANLLEIEISEEVPTAKVCLIWLHRDEDLHFETEEVLFLY